ncbi:hypothetical protein V5799_025686 [Amblyomma americanum]|uniref:DNA-directed RNA polymerase n=1 Tax=Amblyomma americanum TaxID=6943 RepID=A0AAQ4E8T7_AMBAM
MAVFAKPDCASFACLEFALDPLTRVVLWSRRGYNEEEEEDALVLEEEEVGHHKEEEAGGAFSYLTPVEARVHLRQLWKHERPLLQHLFGVLALASRSHESPVDMFFLEALVVPPTRFRPMNFLHGRKYEHPQTVGLSKVLQCCNNLSAVLRLLAAKDSTPQEEHMEQLVSKLVGKDLETKMHLAWHALQVAVNVVVDSELDRLNSSSKGTPGIKQVLEKKEGLFRKHMMGKRVNYAARSVISPDPYIDVEEIGVPMVFATRLSYPEPVTERNIAELRRAVINGPDVYPGALLVEREDGVVMRLDPGNRTRREAVAKQLLTPTEAQQPLQRCKTVHRHLRSGDMLLLNRQPTLHKPSIMAHRARVLPGERTLRLHYANCKCYNADFDGDEMNAHLPQSPLAQAEAAQVATVNRQYLVPKDGTPLSGLIQDHVIGGSLLTMQGRFFTREDYNQLVFGALAFVKVAIKLLPPAILKPQLLWTGKQARIPGISLHAIHQLAVSRVVFILGPNLPAPTSEAEIAKEEEVVSFIEPASVTKEKLRQAALDKGCLETIKSFVLSSWPPKKSIPGEAKPLYPIREENSVDNLLLRVEGLVVPSSLTAQIIGTAHETHPGLTRTKARLRERF